MLRFVTQAVIMTAAVYLLGCTAAMQPPVSDEDLVLPADLQRQALTAEEEGRYDQALQQWRRARELIGARMEAISEHLQHVGLRYAEIGEKFYRDRKGKKALGEFIDALRHDPANETALDYLLNHYEARDTFAYTVEENDTFASIAAKAYGEKDHKFLPRYFSGVEGEDLLRAGMVLQLPVLDSFYSPQLEDYRLHIVTARTLLEGQRFQELLPLAEKLHDEHPADEEASYILGRTLVGLSEQLREQKRYLEAAEVLSRVDPSFKDVREETDELRRLHKQKEKEDIRKDNASLYGVATDLLNSEQYVAALKMLRQIDPAFRNVPALTAEVQEMLHSRADRHYKQGVSFYIDDNLEAAIEEWQKTLHYLPEHDKAAANIVKARRLLHKVESLD